MLSLETKKRAAERTMEYEGLVLHPYLDSRRYLTVGYGHLLAPKPIEPTLYDTLLKTGFFSQSWPKEVCDVWFYLDYREAEKDLQHLCGLRDVDLAALSPARQAVLLDLTFNLGLSRYSGFPSHWGALKDGNFEEAAYQLLWNGPNRPTPYQTQTGRRARENAELLHRGEW